MMVLQRFQTVQYEFHSEMTFDMCVHNYHEIVSIKYLYYHLLVGVTI